MHHAATTIQSGQQASIPGRLDLGRSRLLPIQYTRLRYTSSIPVYRTMYYTTVILYTRALFLRRSYRRHLTLQNIIV